MIQYNRKSKTGTWEGVNTDEKQYVSYMLVETVVKNALKNMKDCPERGIRNLADMALQFSESRFQKSFLTDIQTMLQNENSAYYELVRKIISYTDTERLYTFGMNVGYNGCTVGARRIRENEKKLNFNIPWAITLLTDETHFEENQQKYHAALRDGEDLGIYVWMLFAMDHPLMVLPLAKEHRDSAFCLFLKAEDLTDEFLDEAADLYNVMLVVRYEERADNKRSELRKRGLLYSAWYQFGQDDTEMITSGDLFTSMQQPDPAFAVLLPEPNCPEDVRRLVYQTVKQFRSRQIYHTLLYEFQSDNDRISSAISGGPCSICFDRNGNLYNCYRITENSHHNLFKDSLPDILKDTCPREV